MRLTKKSFIFNIRKIMDKEMSRREFISETGKRTFWTLFAIYSTDGSVKRVLDYSSPFNQQLNEKKEILAQAQEDYHTSRDPSKRLLLKERAIMFQEDVDVAQNELEKSEGGFLLYYLKWPMTIIGIPYSLFSIYKTTTSIVQGWKAYKRYTLNKALEGLEKSLDGLNLDP